MDAAARAKQIGARRIFGGADIPRLEHGIGNTERALAALSHAGAVFKANRDAASPGPTRVYFEELVELNAKSAVALQRTLELLRRDLERERRCGEQWSFKPMAER
jgi:hypothetical protein